MGEFIIKQQIPGGGHKAVGTVVAVTAEDALEQFIEGTEHEGRTVQSGVVTARVLGTGLYTVID